MKTVEPFIPLHGDESMEAKLAAFNNLGANQAALHECMDAGFEEATTGRLEVAAALKAYIAKTDAYQAAMVVRTTENHNNFITMQGQLKAMGDDVAIASHDVNQKVEKVADRLDLTAARLDTFGEALLRIGSRIGADKPGEIKTLSWWKIATTVGSAIGVWTILLKVLPLIPALDKALLGR